MCPPRLQRRYHSLCWKVLSQTGPPPHQLPFLIQPSQKDMQSLCSFLTWFKNPGGLEMSAKDRNSSYGASQALRALGKLSGCILQHSQPWACMVREEGAKTVANLASYKPRTIPISWEYCLQSDPCIPGFSAPAGTQRGQGWGKMPGPPSFLLGFFQHKSN